MRHVVTGPDRTWVMLVGRFVKSRQVLLVLGVIVGTKSATGCFNDCCNVVSMQRGGQHQCCLAEHFDDVLVAQLISRFCWVRVDCKDVHGDSIVEGAVAPVVVTDKVRGVSRGRSR